MQSAEIRITVNRKGRRRAYYRPQGSGHWFHLSVAEYERGVRAGQLHIGLFPNTPVTVYVPPAR